LNERIKKLRKVLDLTQREFGERIGVKPNTIATYEIGRNEPIDAVISLICREFNVDENWLRTGEGEMFLETPDTAMGRLAKELGLDEFMQGVVSEYLKLNVDQRKVVRDFVYKIAEQPNGEPAAPVFAVVPGPEPENKTQEERLLDVMSKDIGDMTDEEYEMYMREVRRQALAEREAEERSSDLSGSKMA